MASSARWVSPFGAFSELIWGPAPAAVAIGPALCPACRARASRPAETQATAGMSGDASYRGQLRAAQPGLPRQIFPDFTASAQAHRISDDVMLDLAALGYLRPRHLKEIGDPVQYSGGIGTELLVSQRH